MKTTKLESTRRPIDRSRHRIGHKAIVAGLALAFLALPTSSVRGEILDTFGGTTVDTAVWTTACFFGPCEHLVANGQVRLSVTPSGDHGFAGLTSVRQWTVREGRTLEFRVDLISCSGDGALARLNCAFGNPNKYILYVDQDTIALGKREGESLQLFFLTNGAAVKVTNVKLVLAMTGGPDSSVLLEWKILDNEQGGRVLFSGSHWDTAGSDPMVEGSYKTGDYPPESFIGMSGRLNISVYHDNAGWFDPQVEIPHLGEAAAVFDNPEVLEYYPTHLKIAPATNDVALSWLLPVEDHIVVAAEQVAGPWCPCQQPHTRTGDVFNLTLPCQSPQKFFMLTPGRQFTDDFSSVVPSWTPWFQEPWTTWIVANGVLQVSLSREHDTSAFGGLALCPLGATNVEAVLRDFYASVDVVEWVTSSTSWSSFALFGRGRMFPTSGTGYFGGILLDSYGMSGRLTPWIIDGSAETYGVPFDMAVFPPPYRVEFSGMGQRMALRVLGLTTGQLIREMSFTNSAYATGIAGLWFRGRTAAGDFYTNTVDNFFLSGTHP